MIFTFSSLGYAFSGPELVQKWKALWFLLSDVFSTRTFFYILECCWTGFINFDEHSEMIEVVKGKLACLA